jgi:hypothetical protein
MPVPVSRLRVHQNPYIKETIDHLGRPAGRVKCDHYEHAKTGLVGAKFVDVVETHAAQSFKVGALSYVTAPARHDHRIAYSRVPVEIPNTGYYRDAIKRGDLFAADRKTWVASGGAALTFVEPATALAKAKKEALEHFDASTGEGAHEEMGSHEPLWFGGDEPAAAPAPVAPAEPVNTPSAEPESTDASEA